MRILIPLGLSLAVIAVFSGCTRPDEPALSPDVTTDWDQMRDIRPRAYTAFYTASRPVIDGRIDDPSWQEAEWSEMFVDIEGSRKPAPLWETRVKMMWDDEYLYVAAKMTEPHVWGYNKEKNTPIYHFDNDFEIFLDPDGDRHNYYEFEGNALNTIWELTLPKPYKDNGSPIDPTNMPGMISAVHVNGTLNDPSDTDDSWTYEFALPWDGISRYDAKNLPPESGDSWRINFSRVQWQYEIVDGRYRIKPDTPENNWVWSPQGLINMHCPEKWGFLFFARDRDDFYTIDLNSLRAEEFLQEVYYRQRAYNESYSTWATVLTSLRLSIPDELASTARFNMSRTEDGFLASLTYQDQTGTSKTTSIDQESHLVRSD